MLTPGVLNLVANRWQPFNTSINFIGYDFTGGALAMQVRASRDRTDAPLITASVTSTTVTTAGVPTSMVIIYIDEPTIESIALSNPAGGDVALVYDLVITQVGLPKMRWLEGSFTIHAGVTHG